MSPTRRSSLKSILATIVLPSPKEGNQQSIANALNEVGRLATRIAKETGDGDYRGIAAAIHGLAVAIEKDKQDLIRVILGQILSDLEKWDKSKVGTLR